MTIIEQLFRDEHPWAESVAARNREILAAAGITEPGEYDACEGDVVRRVDGRDMENRPARVR